jgi:AAA family ATP:ADP antiporter
MIVDRDRSQTPANAGRLHMTEKLNLAEREEDRLKRAAFVTLFCLLAGHALLETARDALFLTHVPAEQLPWMYLSIAAVVVLFALLRSRSYIGADHRQELMALQILAAIGTLGFWILLPGEARWLYYALYIWSGVIGGLLVVTFWLVLGDLFTITQGKRIYAAVGTGGAVGAIGGFGLASGLTAILAPEFLLLVSALAFALSILGPWKLLRTIDLDLLPEPERSPESGSSVLGARDLTSVGSSLTSILGHPYACRIALLVVVSSMTLTMGDYLFKSVLAETVPAESLPGWLARIYFAFNTVSLLILMFGVTRVIHRLTVHRTLAILPVLIIAAALGILAGGVLLPVLLLKSADGTLRYSLHKTAVELLYLPMPAEMRAKVKRAIDIVGQRSANALGALVILFALTMGTPTLIIAGSIFILAAIWIYLALDLRGAYLDVFREALAEKTIATRVAIPELDLASLETLIRTLNHSDDGHVLGALEILDAQGKVDLIPSLILYHPSSAVVIRTLDLFARSGRRDFTAFADRLLENDDPDVRAAVVRATWAVKPNRQQLEALLEAECSCVHISAVIGLWVNQWIDPELAQEEVEETLRYPAYNCRLALANAIKLRHLPAFRRTLEILVRDPAPEVRREALSAIRLSADDYYTPLLVQLLDDREIRDQVRTALNERGDTALLELSKVLAGENVAPGLLRHVPRAISRFQSVDAANILLQQLIADQGGDGESRGESRDRHSGMVRYKILRALGPLLSGPVGDQVDKSPLLLAVTRTIRRVMQNLHWQTWLEQGRETEPARQTCGSELLLQLLKDKERLALQRVFRMLFLIQPEENFRDIWTGLQSTSRRDRASSIELLDNILGPQLRVTVGALVGSGSVRERLEKSGSDLAGVRLEYSELLAQIEGDQSRVLGGLAMYHAAEIEVARPSADALSMREQALAMIEEMPEVRPGKFSASSELETQGA